MKLSARARNVNAMTLQPFLNYNLPDGWYLTTSPLMTANWEANRENRWTVPMGGGFARIFKIGDQSVNANIAAYYNVVTPEGHRRQLAIARGVDIPFPDKVATCSRIAAGLSGALRSCPAIGRELRLGLRVPSRPSHDEPDDARARETDPEAKLYRKGNGQLAVAVAMVDTCRRSLAVRRTGDVLHLQVHHAVGDVDHYLPEEIVVGALLKRLHAATESS